MNVSVESMYIVINVFDVFFFFFFCLQESDSQPCLAELFIGTYLDMTVTKDLKSIKVRSDLWLLSFILQVLIIPEQFRPAR